jgi:hypothetical protein
MYDILQGKRIDRIGGIERMYDILLGKGIDRI